MKIINKNFQNKNQAVEHTKNNLEMLVSNLINVSEDVVRSYAEFKHIPIGIDAISEDEILKHYQMLTEILVLINVSEDYLSNIKSDIDKYFRPEVCNDKMKSKIKSDVDNHLYEYVDCYCQDADVVYYDDDILTSGMKPTINIDDGMISEVKLFK